MHGTKRCNAAISKDTGLSELMDNKDAGLSELVDRYFPL